MARAQQGDAVAYRAVLTVIAARAATTGDPARVERALRLAHVLRHTCDPRRPFEPWLAGIVDAAAQPPKPPASPWTAWLRRRFPERSQMLPGAGG